MEIKTFEDLAGAFGTHHDAVKAAFSEMKTAAAGTAERLNEIEQKMARRPGSTGGSDFETLGAKFIAQDGVRAFAERKARSDSFGFETKATVTSTVGTAAGNAGSGIRASLDPDIVPLVQRRPVVRDLLPVIPINSGSVDVIKVTGRTSGAAPVAEGALKPASDLKLALENQPARVIAHWIKASRQVLEDLPQLQGLIDTELMDGLMLEEEDQILNGDGTAQNLDGLVANATAYAQPFTIADPTMLDTVGLGLLQNALAEFPATGVIMHPSDWTRITLLKDADGNYIMGAPGSPIAQRLWGIPVITTSAMAIDKFMVGDFRRAATLYDRWTARIEIGTVDDDFTRNLLTVLAEERLALAVKQATALTYGDFGNVT